MHIIDLHSDFPADVLFRKRRGEVSPLRDIWLPRWKSAGVALVTGAVYVEPSFVSQAQEHALEMIAYVTQECAGSRELALVRTSGEIESAIAAGKTAILLSLEGAEPLGSLSDLRLFYDRGVRLLGLTWSRPGPAGYGHTFDAAAIQRKEGLTDFGWELLWRGEELGMIIDVSHLNDEGFLDVEHGARKPYIASHSNSRAVWGSPRNVTDAQAACIAKRGGLIGLNAATVIAGQGLTPHAERWRALLGTAHIACGFDFGDDIHYFNDLPSGDALPGYPGISAWADELRARGWSPGEVEGVLGGNAMRFFRRWL
jgi:membrane dipeptidase